MVPIGSSKVFLTRFVKRGLRSGLYKDRLTREPAQTGFNNTLAKMTADLRAAAAEKDAALSLHLERACIELEQRDYIVTPNDAKRIEKQISESGSAEESLALVKNPQAYRDKIQNLFPGGLKAGLPEGDAYIVHARRQIHQLAQYQKGMATKEQKEYFQARQDNLRAGIAAFKALQQAALAPLFRA